jgi:lysophospholipase L1-like esterase
MRQIEKVFSWIGDLWKITGIVVLLLVMGHYFIDALVYIDIQMDNDNYRENLPDIYSELHDDFFEEKQGGTDVHFEPYYYWRTAEFHSKYVNIGSDGLKQTIKIPPPEESAKKVFLFGGSTMFGSFVPDKWTIPSFLQSLLGTNYDVYNLGQSGYVSTQELNFLLMHLASGNRPDVVIFYDGVNDGYSGTFSPAIPRYIESTGTGVSHIPNKSLFSELYYRSRYPDLVKYITKRYDVWDNLVEAKIDENAKQTIDVYEAHIKQVKALAREYGFKAFFFWQPNLLSLTREVFPYETKMINNFSDVFIKSQRQVYLNAKEKFSNREQDENIYFIGQLFDKVKEPMYLDWCHVGGNGNQIVANEIYERIKLKLSSSSVD